MQNDEWMRVGQWTSDTAMSAHQEAEDRRFLEFIVANAPGPASQWRTEVAVSIGDRHWRWHTAHPLTEGGSSPLER
jgi:hypothetical protein